MSEDPLDTSSTSEPKSRREELRLKKKEEERLRKEAEIRKKNEEREKKELEKKKKEQEKLLEKKKKEEERLKREQEKEDEKRKREEERLKKEQEKEEEKRKREEDRIKKEQERETERKLKEAEKQKREEERLRKKAEKEEELRKKEEEKKLKEREEEEKQKKQKRQSALLLNFVVKENKETSFNPVSNDRPQPERFMKFICKKDQKLAPINRVSEELRQAKKNLLDSQFNKNPDENIVADLKKRKPLTYPDTWSLNKPDVFMAEVKDEESYWLKAKLFQFIENNRPAYYGSWRQKSSKITGRNPFKLDLDKLNYDIDSDEEWEEDEPGESIASSDNEEEEEEKEESDEDDFLVPHGYLSDDEGVHDDEMKDSTPSLGPDDKMKAMRQKLSVAVYEAAHERGSHKIHPKLFGCLWINDNDADNEGDSDFASENKENIIEMLPDAKQINDKASRQTAPPVKRYEVKITEQVLIKLKAFVWPNESKPIKIMNNLPDLENKMKQKKVKCLPDECLPYLVSLVHNCGISRKHIAFEFRSFWHQKVTGKLPLVLDFKQFTALNSNQSDKNFVEHLPFTQALVSNKIFEIASFESKAWIVKSEIIEEFRQESVKVLPDNDIDPETKLPIWKYVTIVKKKGSEKNNKSLLNKTDDELNKSTKEDKSGTPNIERKRSNASEFFQPKGKKQCV